MGRDVDERAGLHLDRRILEPQPCRTLQQQNKLVLVLIVPKALGRCVAVRDDPLDAEAGLAEDRLDQFFGKAGVEISEEVGGTVSPGPSFIFTLPTFPHHRTRSAAQENEMQPI